MGHHQNPRRHLRRFEISTRPGFIWMYDKDARGFKPLPVDKVAQAPRYYPDDIEIRLNQEIEIPGSNGIEKLLRQEHLNEEERWSVAQHIFVMHTRGPRRRRLNQHQIAEALANVFEEMREQVQQTAEPEDDVSKLLQEISRLEKKWSNDRPDFVDRIARTPFQSHNTVATVFNMAWHVVPAADGYAYITSDTPAHFLRELG